MNNRHRTPRAFSPLQTRRILLFAGFSLLLALLPAGCGKKGFPQPQDTSQKFSWKEVDAKAVGDCLAFTGSFEGEYRNFDGIRLEISRLNGPEDCPGCPFIPQEVTELSAREAGFDRKNGAIAFSYCPQRASAYRWRLAAISVFTRLPHADMTDRLLVLKSWKKFGSK
ncbi:MAG: hypothetical protein LBC94_05355 [Desulfovibrio sp.]|jgi:hypothetical protein|nr:hypothetical protein [Desulfovibrio sp.]